MEGRGVVSDILEEILQDLFQNTEWDIAWKAKYLRQNGRVQKTRPMLAPGPHFNLCEVVRNSCSSRVVCNYSLRENRVEVVHLQCVQQQVSGYCGHYALHFALCCLEICNCATRAEVLGYLGETYTLGAFWRRYWLSISQLLENVSEEEVNWPWTKSHVYQGEMERSYLSYILSCDLHLQSLGRERAIILHYAYGCIQNTVAEVCEMQEQLDRFKAGPAPNHIVFILGVTNHWLTAVAYKSERKQGTADTASAMPGDTGIVYLDSNNVPVLRASDAVIRELISEAEAKRIKRKGKGYSDWKRGVIFQAFVDQRALLGILAQCLTGAKDLRMELLDSLWTIILDSYDKCVKEKLCGCSDKGLQLALLTHWLETEHRPQSMRNHQLKTLRILGAGLLSSHVRKRIMDWIESLQPQCGCSSGIEVLEAFAEFLSETAVVLQ